MELKKIRKINVSLIFIILVVSLIPNINSVSARYNWVEWEGTVYNDWGNVQSGVTVRLKLGSITLDSDVTDSNGYYYIKEYVDNSYRYALKASLNSNWTTQQYTNLIGRPEASGPWEYNFNLYYVQKWAVIVGIEDYEIYTDEDYSDNDADEWNDQLTNSTGLDFDHITVLKNSAAIESAIKSNLNAMVSGADGGDIVAFIFSGKGYDNGCNYALMAHDAGSGDNGEDGDLYDTELAAIMNSSIAERVFFFFDCCYAYGMKFELDDLDNSDTFFLAAATEEDESSFQDTDAELRCWTQCFLNYAWRASSPQGNDDSITADFNDIWSDAYYGYTYYRLLSVDYYNIDQVPQRWNPYGSGFCLSKYGITP